MQRNGVLQFLILLDGRLCSGQDFNHLIEISSTEQFAAGDLESVATDPNHVTGTILAEPQAPCVDVFTCLDLTSVFDLRSDLIVEDFQRIAATNVTSRCACLEEFQCVRQLRSTFAPAASLLPCFSINSR